MDNEKALRVDGTDRLDDRPPVMDLPPNYDQSNHPTVRFEPLRTEQPRPCRRTSEISSILPRYSVARYGIYGSEEEYLVALRAWAEEKSYVRLGEKTALTGFYGKKTMEDYKSQPGLWGHRKKEKDNGQGRGNEVNGGQEKRGTRKTYQDRAGAGPTEEEE
ncbi:MAG: hypothetical protein Q9166_005355 [cf. Caloplaca sp. 2 TL-2023]